MPMRHFAHRHRARGWWGGRALNKQLMPAPSAAGVQCRFGGRRHEPHSRVAPRRHDPPRRRRPLRPLPRLDRPYDPLAFDFNALLAAPSAAHPFGTDQFGRDMLSRTISAARIDLQIAIFATLFPCALGTPIGLFVGVRRHRRHDLRPPGRPRRHLPLPRPGDRHRRHPRARPGQHVHRHHHRRLGRLRAPHPRRGAGAEIERIRRRHPVLGYSTPRILFRHILPERHPPRAGRTSSPTWRWSSCSAPRSAISASAPSRRRRNGAFSIADGKNFFTQAPWIALFPGAVIVLAGLGFSLTGDGLADLLDVKR
jgi:peptide/nickel transport system permease protein